MTWSDRHKSVTNFCQFSSWTKMHAQRNDCVQLEREKATNSKRLGEWCMRRTQHSEMSKEKTVQQLIRDERGELDFAKWFAARPKWISFRKNNQQRSNHAIALAASSHAGSSYHHSLVTGKFRRLRSWHESNSAIQRRHNECAMWRRRRNGKRFRVVYFNPWQPNKRFKRKKENTKNASI